MGFIPSPAVHWMQYFSISDVAMTVCRNSNVAQTPCKTAVPVHPAFFGPVRHKVSYELGEGGTPPPIKPAVMVTGWASRHICWLREGEMCLEGEVWSVGCHRDWKTVHKLASLSLRQHSITKTLASTDNHTL